jgi:hypothetical protein
MRQNEHADDPSALLPALVRRGQRPSDLVGHVRTRVGTKASYRAIRQRTAGHTWWSLGDWAVGRRDHAKRAKHTHLAGILGWILTRVPRNIAHMIPRSGAPLDGYLRLRAPPLVDSSRAFQSKEE